MVKRNRDWDGSWQKWSLELEEDVLDMADEVWFDNLWWACRNGNRICIGKSYEQKADPTEAILVLALTDDGGLGLDPKWERLRRAEIVHQRMWWATLRKLALPVVLEARLSEPPPLCLFSEQVGMLEYLRKVARGQLYSSTLEKEERELLTQALDMNFPEGQA